MTQAAETAPATTDQIVDRLLRQIEAAWVTEEFDAIIEANWPTGPPQPPPTAGPAHAEPPRPGSPAPVPPRGELMKHETIRECGAVNVRHPEPPTQHTERLGTAELPARSGHPVPRRGDRPPKAPSPTHRIGALQQHP